MTTISFEAADQMIKTWMAEVADHPAIYNQGNVLRDRLAALPKQPSAEDAAKWVEARHKDYVEEFGQYDPSTGMVDFSQDGEEYVGELEEIIEGIRAIQAA